MCRYCGTRQVAEIFMILVSKHPYLFAKPTRTVAFQVLFFQNACGSKVHFSWLFFALKQASFLLETDG